MLELLFVIFAVFVVVSIAIYLFKTMTKLFIGLGIAYLLFHIGFLWNYNELDSSVPVLDYFKPEYSSKFKSWYEDLTEKRYEYAMLDIDKMDNDIDVAIKNSINYVKEEYTQLDKEKLLETLYSELKEYNFDEVESSLLKLKDEMINSGITEEEFQSLVTELQTMSSNIDDVNSRLDEIEKKINE